MGYNNKIIKILSFTIIILFIFLIINLIIFKNEIINSFVISLATGAIVSLFVAYMDYKKEKNEMINYCNNKISKYYALLDSLLVNVNKKVKYVEKVKIVKEEYINYCHNYSNDKIVEFNLILYDIDSTFIKKIYLELYNYTNGIELSKFFKNTKAIDFKKLKKCCIFQKKRIDEGMELLINYFKINYPWEEMKKIYFLK